MPIIYLPRFDEESASDLRHLGHVIVGALRTSSFFVVVGHGVRRDVDPKLCAGRRKAEKSAPRYEEYRLWFMRSNYRESRGGGAAERSGT